MPTKYVSAIILPLTSSFWPGEAVPIPIFELETESILLSWVDPPTSKPSLRILESFLNL